MMDLEQQVVGWSERTGVWLFLVAVACVVVMFLRALYDGWRD